MRELTEKTDTKHAPLDISCNVCGRETSKDAMGYFEDHVSISKAWGYHSPYDGEIHSIDVCVNCYQDWIAKFEIPPKVSYYFHFEEDGQFTCSC